MLRLNVEKLRRRVATYDVIRTVGKLRSATGLLTASVSAAVGDLCEISPSPDRSLMAEVVGLDRGLAQIMPYEPTDGLGLDTSVVGLGRKLQVPVGAGLLGRVIGALGNPVDGRGPLGACGWTDINRRAPSPMERPRIRTPLVTGQRVIDGLLTIGQGQRLALLAGTGVGKSTLLGQIAKGASSDLNVIALVGERGREVRPFLDDCLGREGLERSVVVVATSDEPPLARVRAAQVAVTIASHFRRAGASVLFLMDSVTRMAMAQREIGLLLGEPPSARGYTPSVFQQMAGLLEQLGLTCDGAITAILTVLVEGNDIDEPISDAVRAIVDGHIVLDRDMAEKGHYPAVNVGQSISRLIRDISEPDHISAAKKLRAILATHARCSGPGENRRVRQGGVRRRLINRWVLCPDSITFWHRSWISFHHSAKPEVRWIKSPPPGHFKGYLSNEPANETISVFHGAITGRETPTQTSSRVEACRNTHESGSGRQAIGRITESDRRGLEADAAATRAYGSCRSACGTASICGTTGRHGRANEIPDRPN